VGEEKGSAKDVQLMLKNLQMQALLKFLNIMRSGVDIPVIFHFLGSDKVSSKMAGFLGTISSSISLYNLWGK
jgi:hypothetical protein